MDENSPNRFRYRFRQTYTVFVPFSNKIRKYENGQEKTGYGTGTGRDFPVPFSSLLAIIAANHHFFRPPSQLCSPVASAHWGSDSSQPIDSRCHGRIHPAAHRGQTQLCFGSLSLAAIAAITSPPPSQPSPAVVAASTRWMDPAVVDLAHSGRAHFTPTCVHLHHHVRLGNVCWLLVRPLLLLCIDQGEQRRHYAIGSCHWAILLGCYGGAVLLLLLSRVARLLWSHYRWW